MTTDAPAHPNGHRGLGHAFRTMPKWKWLLMAAGVTLGIVGVGGQLASKGTRRTTAVNDTPATHVAPSAATAPPGSSGFVGDGGPAVTDATPSSASPPTTPTASPTLMDQATPYMTKFGFSFAVGLVLGLVFRTFLGFATLLTGLVVAAAVALSYFHVINVDLSSVKAQTGQATTWLSEQGGHLKGVIFAHLPSTGAAGAGFLVGMKRR